MTTLKKWMNHPSKRHQLLTIASGLFIAGGLAMGHFTTIPSIQSLFMIVAAVIAGADIAAKAWRGLRNRHISIELLVTIAATGALFIGQYWESAAVTFLFKLGAYLEARTLSRTRKTLQSLLELAPETALVIRNEEEKEVPVTEVEQGEQVVVKPGGKVPVDGTIIDGASSIDESSITGESIPVDKTNGSEVFAGTFNQTGLVVVRATQVGADTTLAAIIQRVEEAQESKAPTQRFIERFSKWYTPSILGLSAAVYLVTFNIELALTLLVIGCPGALVISTPISVIAGVGRAARNGILIKGGEYLESAGKLSALAMDKTGTLTEGRPYLTDVISFEPAEAATTDAVQQVNFSESTSISDVDLSARDQEVLYWAAIAESGSEHPLSRAVMESAGEMGTVPRADTFESVTGKGIKAGYGQSSIAVGTEALMMDEAVYTEPRHHEVLKELKEEGKTVFLVAVDGAVLGVIGIADRIRSTAAEAVSKLKKAGMRRVVMVTGDDQKTANTIARQAGIDEVYAGLLPDDKLDYIKKLQKQGHVTAMVGDGINDAPSLATADIGIAMGAAGTDVALDTADIALMSDDLLKVPEAIVYSKKTLGNIRQNVVIALLTVAGLLGGVLMGEVHMAGGMFIHEVSVLAVIVNGMRLLWI